MDCFAARAATDKTLPGAIKDLLDDGVDRPAMFNWALAAGYGRATVRSLLSRAFCSLGLRARAPGAGRKPSADALELLAHARKRYGDLASRVLRAAYRAGRTATQSSAGDHGRSFGPIAEPQLSGTKIIEGPQLPPATLIVSQAG